MTGERKVSAPGFEYSPARFLEDIRTTAAAIGAPFSESVNRTALDVYADGFATGAVLWRTTDRPGDALNYRFYARKRYDTVSAAVRAGLLPFDSVLASLVTSWSALYQGTPEQSCDFDAGRGLVKTWVYLGGTRPLDDVLDADGVPDTIRRHAPLFHDLGLDHCRHVAVDYTKNTVNLYFRARGPLTDQQCVQFTKMVRSAPPAEQLAAEMREYLSRNAYTFSVTVSVDTGALERVGFYALKLPDGRFPTVGERLSRFYSAAPSYDADTANAIAWSFGAGDRTYIKAERSCYGDLVSLMRRWNTFFSGDDQIDAALQTG